MFARIAIASAITALVQPALAQGTIPKKPIQFAKGSSSATVKGTIKGDQTVDYTVNARAGQTLKVDFEPSNAAAYFNLIKPSETDVAFFIGSTEGNSFTGAIPESGDTRIRVYLMRSAARRNETATYTLTVAVTGKGATTAAAATGDAMVAGTGYNATGSVPCARGGQPMGQCSYGVVRSDRKNGNGRIEVSWPDGGKRVVFYEMNTPTSFDQSQADANKKMTVSKSGPDLYEVRIGDERFEIPEAVMTGG